MWLNYYYNIFLIEFSYFCFELLNSIIVCNVYEDGVFFIKGSVCYLEWVLREGFVVKL